MGLIISLVPVKHLLNSMHYKKILNFTIHRAYTGDGRNCSIGKRFLKNLINKIALYFQQSRWGQKFQQTSSMIVTILDNTRITVNFDAYLLLLINLK